MIYNKNILITGGDRRFLFLGDFLKENNTVSLLGFENAETELPSVTLNEAENGRYDYIVLPVPSFKDGFVNSPYSDFKISYKDVLSMIKKDTVLLGAVTPRCFTELLEKERVSFCDYFSREDLTIKNARLTAEGAVSLLIEKTDFSLCGASVLILGYGRIGKVLAGILKGFGCRPEISARKASDFALIKGEGLSYLNTADVKDFIGKYDIVINTIPAIILGEEELSLLKKDCVVLDLASLPGGVSKEAARELSVNLINAPGLPAKTAPKEAGKIIFEAIENIEKERSESLE